MHNGIHRTSQTTIDLIRKINSLMEKFQSNIRRGSDSIFSKELLEGIFKHPYTKIKFVENDLAVYRHTASKYLDKLVELKLLTPHKMGRSNYLC